MLKDQKVCVKWNGQTKKYWIDKGYKYTHIGDEFLVDVHDLPPKSGCMVIVQCDYCQEEFLMAMYSYTADFQCGKIACKNCRWKKAKETNIQKYGVENPMQVDSIHDKMKQTMKNKYGVEHPSQSKELHQKAVDKFDKVKASEKRKRTCLEKYGVTCSSKNQDVILKAKQTCLIKFGGESSQCDANVRKKSFNTLMSNGNIPISKAEKDMVDKIKEIYGVENCYPQYIFDRCIFDCLLIKDGIKIDIEYDGIYWHQDKEKDKRRDYYTMKRGIKVLRFQSKYHTPTVEQIKYGVDYLVNSEHHHLIIDI